jgi:hypothetical protein
LRIEGGNFSLTAMVSNDEEKTLLGRIVLAVVTIGVVAGLVVTIVHRMRPPAELPMPLRTPSAPSQLRPVSPVPQHEYVHHACLAAKEDVVSAELCDIVKRPDFFNHKCVRISADVLSDGHHGIILVRSGCKRGLQVNWPEQSYEQADIAAFYKTAMTEWRNNQISGTFLGRVDWEPTESSHGRFTLDITAIPQLQKLPIRR